MGPMGGYGAPPMMGMYGMPPQQMYARPGMMGPRPGMPMMGMPGMNPMMQQKGGMPPQMMGQQKGMQKGMPPQQMMQNQRPPMQKQAGGAPTQMPGPNEPLTAAALAAAPPGMQKQMLGEKLFPLIPRFQPELAGKVTGMMLEMDNSELLMLLESEAQLQQKVN